MKKLAKWFGIFAVIGTVIGLAVAYFYKNSCDDLEENETEFTEDEDFDLDADLQPAEREYVSLNKETAKTSANETEKQDSEKEEL